MSLVHSVLTGVATELEADPHSDTAWGTAREALAHYGIPRDTDPQLTSAIEGRDADSLARIVQGWHSGDRVMLEHDRSVLKRAMKAYRKSLKVTILDAESSLGGGPMSSGRRSTITGIMPPRRYPLEVWDQLVHQGRLAGGRRGIYELPPGG
ncbi:hypothetical protein Poly30_19370 [Planctomycetes bacterium Poly30]|uniref:Uncharacterized protein n=2 Tax=Saltatorellus ferox TaxID=2528018 RepID=A0A518EQR2_9BACT|nr:hypothetical protein Poly30_19370 [Planctomycetes bacterium Poly30]